MRHLNAGRGLGVKPAHRRAMMRNMVTSLVEHEQIKTTVARAKEVRKPLDRMITLGKRGDLSARRRALRFVKSKESMAKLFGALAERYAERAGGYTRILRLGPRRGDGADMALIMLVGNPNDPFAETKKPRRRGGGRKQSKPVLDEVADEVRAGDETKAPAATDAEPEATATASPAETGADSAEEEKKEAP